MNNHPQSFGKWKVETHLQSGPQFRGYKVKDDSGQTCFLKHPRPDHLKAFYHETELLQEIGDHKHIVQLIDYDVKSDTPYAVHSYTKELFRDCSMDQLKPLKVEEMFTKLIKAVGYLHSQGIIHNALEAIHMRKTSDGTPVLIHFQKAEKITGRLIDTTTDIMEIANTYKKMQTIASATRHKAQQKARQEALRAKQTQPRPPKSLAAE